MSVCDVFSYSRLAPLPRFSWDHKPSWAAEARSETLRISQNCILAGLGLVLLKSSNHLWPSPFGMKCCRIFLSPWQPVPPIPIPLCHIRTTTIFLLLYNFLKCSSLCVPLSLIMIDLERSVSSFAPCLAQFWVLLLPHTPQQLEAALIWCGLDRWDKTRWRDVQN